MSVEHFDDVSEIESTVEADPFYIVVQDQS